MLRLESELLLKPTVAILVATAREEAACEEFVKGSLNRFRVPGGDFPLIDFGNLFVVIYRRTGKGNLDAAIATRDLIRHYRPACIVAVGVCGKNPDLSNVSECDVIVGTETVYYEPRKDVPSSQQKPEDWEPKVLPAPGTTHAAAQEALWGVLRGAPPKAPPARFLRDSTPKREKVPHPRVVTGLYASGEHYQGDPEGVRRLSGRFRRDLKRDFAAVDMETAGIALACSVTKTKFLFMKAVSDPCAPDRENKWQRCAATGSAVTALCWIRGISEDGARTLLEPVWFPTDRSDFEGNPRQHLSDLAELAGGVLPARMVLDEDVKERATDTIRSVYDPVIEAFLARAARHLGLEFVTDKVLKKLQPHDHSGSQTERERLSTLLTTRSSFLLADAIDGTQNLAAGRREVAVSIAYYEKGEPKAAAIHMPYLDLTVGADQQGIVVDGLPYEPPRGQRELRRAVVALPGDTARLLGNSANRRLTRQLLARLPAQVNGIRVSGSVAYDLASLVLGQVDARISTHVTPADWAAGAYLIERIQGCATDLDGRPLTPGSTTLLAAATRELHAALLKLCLRLK